MAKTPENEAGSAADLARAFARWQEEVLAPALAKHPERQARFSSLSDREVPRLSGPPHLEGHAYQDDLGFPGQYPYTRGVYPTMYRGRPWTMRQFAGFGTAADTNARFRYLLSKGQKGLSIAFDMPTLMGYDSDHERSRGEVGREGVAVDSIDDMQTLLDGIPLDEVSSSMTINSPAPILFALYVAVAIERGIDPKKLGGTLQNDILKEYVAQKEWICPPRPSMRLITDLMAWSADEVPRWNTISISGYHIREAGSTAVQELAFTLADGIAYVQAGIDAGLDPDTFAPRLSFFFNAHNDFFEEIAKIRAARRMWARIMRERFKAKNPESWKLRTHTQTAGVSLTAQQPYNNIVRVAIQALAGVLGGTNSLHTNSLDETLSLPTEEAVTIAMRTQQIIAHESGVADHVDPLAGSYHLERMTNEMEAEATAIIDRVDQLGGMIGAIEEGYPMREIAEAAFRYQQQVEKGEKHIVGVNCFVAEEEPPLPILKVDEAVERDQVARLRAFRESRDAVAAKDALEALRRACQGTENTMARILDAVRARATMGEICDVFRDVWGVYQEPKTF
ncbi:MAG: methylmalonyl-CoA mutase [Myxococcota bacterium]